MRFLKVIYLPLGVLALSLGYFFQSEPPSAIKNKSRVIGFIQDNEGYHSVKNQHAKLWNPLILGDPVHNDDEIKTDEYGEIRLQFTDERGVLRIESGSRLVLKENDDGIISFYVREGAFHLDSKKPTQFKVVDGREYFLHSNYSFIYKEPNSQVIMNPTRRLAQKNPYEVNWTGESDDFELETNAGVIPSKLFTWAGNQATQKDIEIAIEWGPTRKNLSNRKKTSVLSNNLNVSLPVGEYFWRWAIYAPDNGNLLWASNVAKARVRNRILPTLVSPLNGITINPTDAQKSIFLHWTPNDHYLEYRVEVARDEDFSEGLRAESFKNEHQMRLTDLENGSYFWRIVSLDKKTKTWIKTKPNRFKIAPFTKERAVIRWVAPAEKTIWYVSKEPSLAMKWSTESTRPVSFYLLRVANPIGEITAAKPTKVTTEEAIKTFPKEGQYQAQVEAYNSDGEMIGHSPILQFELKPLPMLRAPAMEGPISVRASNTGNVTVQWRSVEGAVEYYVELRASGQRSFRYETKGTSYSFNKLLPGSYEVRVVAIDKTGRPGYVSESREIYVPQVSAVKPLKIKKLEVR
jgi:hypothetical protein